MGSIFKRGNNWHVSVYHKGKRIRKKIGPSKTLAKLALNDLEVKIAKGDYLGIYEEKRVLFKDYATEYLQYSRANKAPKTYLRDEGIIRLYLIPFFDNYLFEITPQQIEQYKANRIEVVKPGTVNKEITCLKNMLTKAVAWGYLQANPAKGIKKLKEPPGRLRYLEAEEINQALELCSPDFKPIFAIAVFTGMRQGEILGLRRSDISLTARTITSIHTKNNERKVIPINDRLYTELRRIPPRLDTDLLFPDWYPVKVDRGLKKIMDTLGIKDFTFHDLKHTFASHLAMAGWNMRTIQILLGHKDMRMTQRYSHLSQEHLAEAVKSLDKIGKKKGGVVNKSEEG